MSDRVRSRGEAVGWLFGVIGPLLVVVGFFAVDAGGTTPADGPSSRLVADLLRDTGRRELGTALGVLGGLLLPFFGASLHTRLERGRPDAHRAAPAAAYGLVLLVVSAVLVHGASRMAVGAVEDPVALGEGVRAIAVLAPVGLIMLSWSAAALVATTSVLALRLRLLPAAWAVSGVVLAGGAAALSTSDRGGLTLALMPWLSVTSALLWRRAAQVAGPHQAASTADPRR